MSAYFMIGANTVKSTFTYRFHILFQTLTSAFRIIVQYFIWAAVFGAAEGGLSSGTIRGMTFSQTFIYVSLAAAIGVLARTWIDWDMNYQIRSGDIIMFLFKPVDYMKFMFSNSIGAMTGNFITITIPSLLVIFLFFHVSVPVGLNIVFFIIALAGSCALSFLFDFFIGTTCFWTLSVWGISAAKDLIIAFLSGALIPLKFYPETISSLVVWLPFPYMYSLPLTILTSSSPAPLEWLRGIGIQFAWIAVMLFVVRKYFRFSLRKLTVNGG